MKRLDLEPNEETILDSLEKNLTGRNDDIVDFIKLLANTEGPFTYMIDAPWGDGKTFFVKSVEYVLKSCIPTTSEGKAPSNQLKIILDKLNGSQTDATLLPFYFNAWKNDFADDPICALFANMAAEFEQNAAFSERDGNEIVPAIANTIADIAKGAVDIANTASDASLSVGLITANPVVIAISIITKPLFELAKAFKRENLVESFTKKKQIREKINSLAKKQTNGQDIRLVIFIDELDRCRPDFAVRLLEQTKNLFVSDKIILVFSTDSCQLAKAVSGAYGQGFDSTRFLDRFYDQKITMGPVNAFDVTHPEPLVYEGDLFDAVIRRLFKENKQPLTLRDLNRLDNDLSNAKEFHVFRARERHPSIYEKLEDCVVVPILIYAKWNDSEIFRNITSGNDLDALYEYGKSLDLFTPEMMQRIAENMDTTATTLSDEDLAEHLRVISFTDFKHNKDSALKEDQKVLTALNFGPFLEMKSRLEACEE